MERVVLCKFIVRFFSQVEGESFKQLTRLYKQNYITKKNQERSTEIIRIEIFERKRILLFSFQKFSKNYLSFIFNSRILTIRCNSFHFFFFFFFFSSFLVQRFGFFIVNINRMKSTNIEAFSFETRPNTFGYPFVPEE